MTENDNRKRELLARIVRLRRSGKIEKAALLDFNGLLLVTSPGMKLCPADTDVIIRALESPYWALMKLKVDSQTYTCLRTSSSSLIGRAEADVLCVYKCVDCIVVGISDPDTPGSSIYEMTRFVKRCYRQSVSSSGGSNSEMSGD